jgi:2,3-diketo-5-methylthio-1-phosphopentane phosphatase
MRAVVSDFDGTITRRDVAELLLDEFTGDAWREIEALHPKIGTRETLRRQFDLVRASRADVLAATDRLAELDPTFPPFVEWCRRQDVHLEIVSEGLDTYLGHLLRRWGLDIPYRTNHAEFRDGRVALSHPFGDPACTLCGACKMGRVLQLRGKGYRVAYVGNGISDICPALEADLVFAKQDLERLCVEHGREHVPYRDFADVQGRLAGWR